MYGIRVMKWTISEKAPTGFISDIPWPEARQEAICLHSSPFPKHPDSCIPCEDCTCGIYALNAFWMADMYVREGMQTRSYIPSDLMFAALVQGFGKIILHKTGWRAAAAEIAGICSLWREPPNPKGVYRAISAAGFYRVPLLNSWEVIQILKENREKYYSGQPIGGDDYARTA